jgi:hypothetical protein
MAEFQKMLDGSLGDELVVHSDIVRIDSVQAASEKHNGNAAVLDLDGEFGRRIHRRAKENSVRRILPHGRHEALLFADHFRGVSQQKSRNRRCQVVFDGDDHLGEKRIGDIGDNQADRICPLGAKTCGTPMIGKPWPGDGQIARVSDGRGKH